MLINNQSTINESNSQKQIQSTFWLGLLEWIDWSWVDWFGAPSIKDWKSFNCGVRFAVMLFLPHQTHLNSHSIHSFSNLSLSYINFNLLFTGGLSLVDSIKVLLKCFHVWFGLLKIDWRGLVGWLAGLKTYNQSLRNSNLFDGAGSKASHQTQNQFNNNQLMRLFNKSIIAGYEPEAPLPRRNFIPLFSSKSFIPFFLPVKLSLKRRRVDWAANLNCFY